MGLEWREEKRKFIKIVNLWDLNKMGARFFASLRILPTATVYC
jgi:hypothetical protein